MQCRFPLPLLRDMCKDINYYSGTYKSPAGIIDFILTEQGSVVYLGFKDCAGDWNRLFRNIKILPAGENGKADLLKEELDEYFAGRRKSFSIPVSVAGTDFQMAVWNALKEIPCGRVESYGSIAHRIGHPRACRAAGTAVGSNRVSIIIPCHRVIKASGKIGSYGGGVERKRYLLSVEGVNI